MGQQRGDGADRVASGVTITLHNDLAELERLAEIVETFGEEAGLAPRLVYSLNLALDELVTNVVSYGYDGTDTRGCITLDLTVVDGRLTAVLQDDGRPFNPLDRGPPDVDSPLEDRKIGGLGVHFVRTLMDEVRYQRVDGRNCLILAKTL